MAAGAAAFAALAAGALPTSARADVVGAAVVRHASPKVDDAPPPANVTLAIEASSPRGAWKMRVTNEGDVPVTIVADARLLALDVTPRSARKAVHCELPGEMRPQDDSTRPLVLPPKRAYVERFEPRLYCLDGSPPRRPRPGRDCDRDARMERARRAPAPRGLAHRGPRDASGAEQVDSSRCPSRSPTSRRPRPSR